MDLRNSFSFYLRKCGNYYLQQRSAKKLHARLIARLFREQKEVKASSTDKRAQRVYVFGLAEYGALGVDFEEIATKKGSHPRKIVDRPYGLTWFNEQKMRLTHVACGYGFTLFAATDPSTKRHTLLGCGLNTDSQIGYHLRSRTGSNRRKDSTNDDFFLANLQRIVLPIQDPSTRIINLGCGRAHSVVVTDNEGIFTFGNNAYGQCAREIVSSEVYRDSHRINRVDLSFLEPGDRVATVECGADHTLLLTTAGRVYACGFGADGQLGSGSFDCSARPLLVNCGDLSERVRHISSRGDTVLAVTESGALVGWGNAEYAQLPSDTLGRDEPQAAKPVRLTLPSECGRVVQACAAGTACALLNDAGDVYTWGYYAVGIGVKAMIVEQPTRVPPALFGRTETDRDVRVEKLVCGLSHFIAITNRGDAFAWGANRYGQLGIGTRAHQPFPYRIALPAQVLFVYSGADHTVVVGKTYA